MRQFLFLGLLLHVAQSPINSQPSRSQDTISGVLDPDTEPQLVKDGFHFLEGPAPTPDGELYFSDINENRIYKLDRSGHVRVWRDGIKGPNGLYLLSDGRLLCAEANGQRIVSISTSGAVTVLASQYKDEKLRAPNDLIADDRGGIYFTDPAPRPAPDVAPSLPGNVYYLRSNGVLILIDGKIARPNGISLSLDKKVLYVDDTEGEYVFAFDVQPDGSVKHKREFVKLKDPSPGSRGLRSRADGMALDSEGRLYIATGSGIQVINSKGQHLGTIKVPTIVRNVAFGGPERHTLYMTAAAELYRISLVSQGPLGRMK